jgi:hypothetical protein
MKRTSSLLTLGCLLVAAAGTVIAGGLWVEVGNPAASAEARALNAALTVRAVGCHNPTDMKISASAIGRVNGALKTIDLKLTPLKEPGFYAVSQQWPAEGRWVLKFEGKLGETTTSSLIPAGPQGVERHKIRSAIKAASDEEIRKMLDAPQTVAASHE